MKPPIPPRITTYYVLPQLIDGSFRILTCDYYTTDFVKVHHPFAIGTCPESPNPGLICFRQPEKSQLPTGITMVPDMWLYAAVVATYEEDLGLPTLFRASAKRSIVIPIVDNTLRGVVFVFAMEANDTSRGKVLDLWPTVDPLIKNGGDG